MPRAHAHGMPHAGMTTAGASGPLAHRMRLPCHVVRGHNG